ncbi:hypothetical protein Emed_001803 [Eimeria media]
MSRKGSDRSSSSAMFVTPRSSSLEDIETNSASRTKFHQGAKMQTEAPEDQSQLPEEKWVDQQQWEEEQRARQQQQQEQRQQQQQQQEEQQEEQEVHDEEQPTTVYPPTDVTQNTEVLNQVVMEQLQQVPAQHDDLDRMVGEGEWQQPLGKKQSWNYSRADSSVNGFSSRGGMETAAACRSLSQSQMSGIQMQNSGIYVEGVQYWNASTNMPVEPMGQEAPQIISRKFTKDLRTGDYTTPILPPVMMTYLPDRFIKSYDRTNCMGQPISSRQHQCSCW